MPGSLFNCLLDVALCLGARVLLKALRVEDPSVPASWEPIVGR